MSLLPQRKKSAAEIAKLREDLGIPGLAPDAAESNHDPANIVPAEREIVPAAHAPVQPAHLQPLLPDAAEVEAPPLVLNPRPVRSLRKSEHLPAAAARAVSAPPDSPLPSRRHSDDEIQQMRRSEALAMQAPVINPKLVAAHPALLVAGYLAAIGGVSPWVYPPAPIAVPLACVGVALGVAAVIARSKPLSLHHAAFLAVICLFVVVFGALHYFPQLGHAT